MERMKFNDEKLEKAYEDRVNKLRKLAEEPVYDQAYLWDATVKRYATTMERVRRILQTEELEKYVASKVFRDMETLLKRCSANEFHIALVGAIKAGKSTLINALLGDEYASTKVTPETAALTKFRKGNQNYVRVSFYSEYEWERLWKSAQKARAVVFLEEYGQLSADNEKDQWIGHEEEQFICETRDQLKKEISRWTSSKSAGHYFVKEVEVGLKDFDLPEGVVLVDTPGLDDVVQYRSNITRDYIDRANAVLVCVKSDALTGPELKTIYSVFANTPNNREKVYIIATQLDTLNDPVQSWEEQRKEWLKSLKGKGAYESLELAEKNLIGVSAYLDTLLQNYSEMQEDDKQYLKLESILLNLGIRISKIDEKKEFLNHFTGIEKLNSKIQDEVVANYKKYLNEDIRSSYMNCKEEIRETMEKLRETQEEMIRTSQGGIEEIRRKQQEYEKKCQEAEADQEALENVLKLFKDTTRKRASELEKAIKSLGGR